MSRNAKVLDFIKQVNKQTDSDSDAGARLSGQRQSIPRLQTGIIGLDIASGGGLPRGKISLLYGPESSGKTTLSIRTCAELSSFCHSCKQSKEDCACGNWEEGVALIIDAEGTYDPQWAELNGINPENVIIVVPESGEQAFSIVEHAVRTGVADLIIIDSLEHCQPLAEIEADISKLQVSPLAKLANKFFRNIVQALRVTKNPPHLMVINQMREKIGVMYGDNTTLPGGKGQNFACALKIRMSQAKVQPLKGIADEAIIEFKGNLPKNKTYIPKKEFTFNINLVDVDALNKAGNLNNIERLIAIGKKAGIVTNVTSGKDKGKWRADVGVVVEGMGKDGLANEFRKDVDLYKLLYNDILEASLMT